ncbi:MAG: hypothetical protein WC455_25885 [Dehalococcoidia bacterium]|jgi:energy-coupling factor transporter ATP-binding protein EcfA2
MSTRPKIIAFSGKAGSGKTTMCNMLQQWLEANGHKTARLSFADAIYNHLFSLYRYYWMGLSDFDKNNSKGWFQTHKDRVIPSCNITIREWLQWYGTDLWRGIDSDIWVKVYESKALGLIQNQYIVLTDDVRFENEVHAIQVMNGNTLMAFGPVYRLTRNLKMGNHESETALDNHKWYPDWLIDNTNQTPDETFADIIKYLEAKP